MSSKKLFVFEGEKTELIISNIFKINVSQYKRDLYRIN